MRVNWVEPHVELEAVTAWVGPAPASEGAIAEVLRAEISAAGCLLRTVLVRRVVRVLGVMHATPENSVLEVQDRLQRAGDLTAADGGLIAATPLRLVDIDETRSLVVSSLPTSYLRPRLGGTWTFAGVSRRIQRMPLLESKLRTALNELGGLRLSLEQWCGFDRPQDVAYSGMDGDAGNPRGDFVADASGLWLQLHSWIPWPEYRFLAALAEESIRVPAGRAGYRLTQRNARRVAERLKERISFEFKGEELL